jgi:hypothetical protein
MILWIGLGLFALGVAGLIQMFFERPARFEPEVNILVDRFGNLIPKDTAEI